MKYEEFKGKLMKGLKESAPEGISMEILERERNNQKKEEVLSFQEEGSTVARVYDLKGLYQRSEEEGIVKCIYEILHAEQYPKELEDVKKIFDWDFVKTKLTLSLIKADWNRAKLSRLLYKEFLDLAVILRLKIKVSETITSTVFVEHNLAEQWKVSEEMIWNTAWENFQKEEFIVKDIQTILKELFPLEYRYIGKELPVRCYVITNQEDNYGASGMLKKKMLKAISNKEKSSLYILPSAVHEVILLPTNEFKNVNELRNMVKIVNQEVVDESERLSDQVYEFCDGEYKVA